MKPKKRQKLCHNCEGEIDVDVIVCPFCAADLREEKPEQKVPLRAYNQLTQEMAAPLEKEEPSSLLPSDEKKEKNFFAPTILFTLGVQLCLLGLLMLLFSHKGVVILKWDAKYWLGYVIASLPFLYFGYKSLSKLE